MKKNGNRPRRGKSCDENSNQEHKKQRLRKGDQNEPKSKKNQQQKQSRNAQLVDDIFVAPGRRRQHLDLKEVAEDQQHAQEIKNEECQNKHHGRKERKQKHQQEASTATDRESDGSSTILEWDSPIGHVPLHEEESMVKFMFQRNGKRERGMLKDKPSFLVSKYKKAVHQHAPSMSLPQALSLRRHHINLNNKFKNMTQLGLGQKDDIDESARLFECAIEAFLKKSTIDFLTEKDQKEKAKSENKILTATPDFVLPKPILLRKIRRKRPRKGQSNKKHHVLEERTIHWIEAKMYYGASSIPHGSKGAVGCVLERTQKYVAKFGEGAILFMMGCGDKLAAEMNAIGVSVLDCSGNTISLDPVHDHQRTWCANEKGQILP